MEAYHGLERENSIYRLGSAAEIGIGYVTGANGFFHLRPSEARTLEIPPGFLKVSVRRGEYLPQSRQLMPSHVRRWIENNEPVLLLHLEKEDLSLPTSIREYLSTEKAKEAQKAFKCTVRSPWYAVPNVTIPHGFLSYMTGVEPYLIKNNSRCVGTNSVHTVRLRKQMSFETLQEHWESPIAKLSCEIEGHPLGGGMLKLEPGEAKRVLLPNHVEMNGNKYGNLRPLMEEGIETMRQWRHCKKNMEGSRAVKRSD